MIDPKIIREKTDILYESLKKRGSTFDVEGLIQLDVNCRERLRN
jgi:seryl-tRNA synthetase